MENTPEITAPVAGSAAPAENQISVGNAECLKTAVIVAVIKGYAKYLLKNNSVNNKDELLEKINPIMSAALDRGLIAMAQLDLITNWVRNMPEFFEATRNEEIMKHSLKCVFKVAATCSNIDDPDIRRIQEIHNECKDICSRLLAKYGETLKATAKQFVAEFSNAFDAGFVSEVSKLFN